MDFVEKGSLVWTWEVWQLVWMNFDEGTPVTLRDLGPRVLDSLEPYDNLQVYEVSFQGKNQGEQLSMSLTPELVCGFVLLESFHFEFKGDRATRKSRKSTVLGRHRGQKDKTERQKDKNRGQKDKTEKTERQKDKTEDKKTKQRDKRQNSTKE